MTIYIYILSFILIFAKIVVPIYLLFRLFFIVKPLFVNLYFEEKFRYYVGINKSRLLILVLIFLLSFLLGVFLGKEVLSVSETYKILLNLFLLVFIYFLLFYMFEI